MQRYLNALHRVRQHNPQARLYALVDGVQFTEAFGETLSTGLSLFEGTPDAPLAHVGPWLIDVEDQPGLCGELAACETSVPLCSWLTSAVPPRQLLLHLQDKLEATLPGGESVVVRFFDPRVLFRLTLTLTAPQREEFFADIDEWHFHSAGSYNLVGSQHA